jgi:two-component system, NtrC family, sensor kinase
MPGLEPNSPAPGRWTRASRSLSAKLIVLLVAAMVGIFALLGFLNIRLHRRHLEAATLVSAERVSDVIKRSTSYYMLRNDREGLYHVMSTMAHEPGMVRIRVINQEGRVSFSTDSAEVNQLVDKRAEACYGCHAQAQPLARLNRPDRFRIYRLASGERALGIINPIENSSNCSSASCHAHPADQQILGVLDTNLSLAQADVSLAGDSRQMFEYTLLAVLLISGLSGIFVWRVVHGPLKVLKSGTERLASGDLGFQIAVHSRDELGELASSFNTMSRELGGAREEVTAWTQELQRRVDQKTAELTRAHDQMLQAEKLASIGKLAAIVAHEINNPLAGILTYAKLLKKWMAKGQGARQEEITSSLELIESESRRCGEIVRNLLVFSRTAPMNCEPADLNAVLDRCARLVRHQLDIANIQLQLDRDPKLPAVQCDAAHIEQVVLALVMNALEAMPHGGNLRLASRFLSTADEVQLQVQDDGVGIPPESLANLFEPFFTTRERGHGLGLGLAISHSIIERHKGRIEVESHPGRGTIFTITVPVRAQGIAREAHVEAQAVESVSVPAAGGPTGKLR